MKTKIAPSKFSELLGLENYPNFSKNGSIKGMKELYYGKNAKLIKCGNYIYNVSSTPELYDNLDNIINELENFENDNCKIRFDIYFQYNGKTSAEWGGDRLTNVVRRLSTLLFFFAGELGEAYRDKNATEYNRKSAFSKKEMELMKSGTSGVAAKSEATVFVDHLLNLEQTADALYKQTNLFYETANTVLEAMRQQVSTLKTEKSLEIKGGLQGA